MARGGSSVSKGSKNFPEFRAASLANALLSEEDSGCLDTAKEVSCSSLCVLGSNEHLNKPLISLANRMSNDTTSAYEWERKLDQFCRIVELKLRELSLMHKSYLCHAAPGSIQKRSTAEPKPNPNLLVLVSTFILLAALNPETGSAPGN